MPFRAQLKSTNDYKKCTLNSICECIFYIVFIEKVQIWACPYLDFLALAQFDCKKTLSYLVITIYGNCGLI